MTGASFAEQRDDTGMWYVEKMPERIH